jgi:hypothetical protein
MRLALRRLYAVPVFAGVAGLVVLVRGCSSPARDTPPDGGRDAGSSQDARSDTPSDRDAGVPMTDAADAAEDEPESDATSCPGTDVPSDLANGWEPYSVFGCRYGFYVPKALEHLPAPLKWEECTDVGPDPYTCRQLTVDWPTIEPEYVGGIPAATREADGRVVLQLRRIQSYLDTAQKKRIDMLAMVAEADGPVRQAIWGKGLAAQGAGASITQSSVSSGRSTWYLQERGASAEFVRWAAIGGRDTDLRPQLLFDRDLTIDPAGGATAVTGASLWAERTRQLRVHGWDGVDHGTVWSGGADLGAVRWSGDTLLWSAESAASSELWSFNLASGAQKLVSFGADVTRGAGNLATDGEVLVWLQGEGRTGDAGGGRTYPTRSVMVAPFETAPENLRPRRLRSWLPPSIATGLAPAAVGCGFAAFSHVPRELTEELFIVRLSDGVAWILRSPADRHWVWGYPVAVTCTEVFVTWGRLGINHLRRLRLDSLGAGMPAD